MRRPIAPGTIYFIGMLLGLLVGTALCVGAFVLVVMGLTGSITWIVQGGGISSKLYNASPGVLFGLIGFMILWRFKPRIKQNEKKTKQGDQSSIVYYHLSGPFDS